jgi:hypothetical protein
MIISEIYKNNQYQQLNQKYMQELFNKLSIFFKNQKELSDHLEALREVNNTKNLNILDLIIFQEMIELIKKQ